MNQAIFQGAYFSNARMSGIKEREVKMSAKILEKHGLLISCIILSLLLFAVLVVLQARHASILNLETKWLLFSGVPILIALIAGGYIKKFKGFGIEVEALLKNPVKKVDLITADAAEELPSDEKRSMMYLESLSQEKKKRIRKLDFNINKKGYYNAYAIEQYIRDLPDLLFFDLSDESGRFVGLLPVDVFKTNDELSINGLQEFVAAIDGGLVLQKYQNNLITDTIGENEKLIDILPKIRDVELEILPVTTKNGRVKGYVDRHSVESRIADEVLEAQKRST